MASKRGRIFKRGHIWWIQYFWNGQDRRESTRSTKESVAKKLLTKRMAAKDAGTLTEADVKRKTFADLRALIEGDYQLNRRPSLDRLQVAFKALGAMFEGWHTGAITKAHLTAYANARVESGKAAATVRYELAVLRRSFKLAEVPCPTFPSIQVENTRTGFFEWSDFCTVLEHLPDYLRPVMTVGYFTGWRVQSELLPLRWSHVDWRTGVMTLDAGSVKNGEGRSYPFIKFPQLVTVLQSQWDAKKQIEKAWSMTVPWVFFRVTKMGVFPIKSYKTAWARATQAAGLPDRLVHDLRRTGVRSLRQAGVPESVAMRLTGHKTRSVFDRYDIVDTRDKANAVEQLAAFHAGAGERDNYGTVVALPVAKIEQYGG